MRSAHRIGLLLVAHGERSTGATNNTVVRLAAAVAERCIVDEVGYGFLKAEPTIKDAVRALSADEIIVWPLFLADGYFTKVRLPQLLAGAVTDSRRKLRIETPLGLDPALPVLIAEKAAAAAHRSGLAASDTTVALLAHGSSTNAWSRVATERLALALSGLDRFLDVRASFLEEAPSLTDAVAAVRGPVVVVGLFICEGRHGGDDLPRLLDALQREALIFAGNIGTWPELAEIPRNFVRRGNLWSVEI